MKAGSILKVATILGVVLFTSCKKGTTHAQKEIVPAEIIRLDSLLSKSNTAGAIEAVLNKYPQVSYPYFNINSGTSGQFAAQFAQTLNNQAFQQFYKNGMDSPAGLQVDSLRKALSLAFSNIKAYDSTFKAPKVYTMFSGFSGPDLLMTDSTIVIGLDYFLGPKAAFRPQLYDYQLYKYDKSFLVPQIVNHIAGRYAKIENSDKSLLADMLFYGKSFQFTKEMCDNAADSLIIAIPAHKLTQSENSQKVIWAHFIDQKLLYEKSDFKKPKYLDERPATMEISPDCPGMIGRWLGWKIVKEYLKNNPKQDLKSLMNEEKAQKIFEMSNYKAQENE